MLLPFLLLLHDCSHHPQHGSEMEQQPQNNEMPLLLPLSELLPRSGPDARTAALIALGSVVSSMMGLTFTAPLASSSSFLGPLLSGAWAAVGLAHHVGIRRGGGGGIIIILMHALSHLLTVALLWIGTEGSWLLLYARVAAFACLLSHSSPLDARTALLRYGAALFADQLLSLCIVCAILGMGITMTKDSTDEEPHHHHHGDAALENAQQQAPSPPSSTPPPPPPPLPPRTLMALRMLTPSAVRPSLLPPPPIHHHIGATTAVDTLDVNEAFRLARAQYLSVVEKTQ